MQFLKYHFYTSRLFFCQYCFYCIPFKTDTSFIYPYVVSYIRIQTCYRLASVVYLGICMVFPSEKSSFPAYYSSYPAASSSCIANFAVKPFDNGVMKRILVPCGRILNVTVTSAAPAYIIAVCGIIIKRNISSSHLYHTWLLQVLMSDSYVLHFCMPVPYVKSLQ